MEPWGDDNLGRAILAFSIVLLAGVWVQLTLFHWGGAFRRREMIAPVLATPVVIACASLGLIDRDGVLGWLALAALAIGVLEGLAGFYFHSQAMLTQVGGLNVRNLIAGPPPVLPVAYSLAGLLGLVGLLWHA